MTTRDLPFRNAVEQPFYFFHLQPYQSHLGWLIILTQESLPF